MSKRKSLPLGKSFGQAHLDQVYELIYQSSGAPHEISQLILGYYPLKVKRISYVHGIYDETCDVAKVSHDIEMDEVYVLREKHIRIYDTIGNFKRIFSCGDPVDPVEFPMRPAIQVNGNEIYLQLGKFFTIYDKHTENMLYSIELDLPYAYGPHHFYLTKHSLCVFSNGQHYTFDRSKCRRMAEYKIYRTDEENIHPIVVKYEDRKTQKYDDRDQTINGLNVRVKYESLHVGDVEEKFKHYIRAEYECTGMTVVGEYIWVSFIVHERDCREYQGIQIYKCEF